MSIGNIIIINHIIKICNIIENVNKFEGYSSDLYKISISIGTDSQKWRFIRKNTCHKIGAAKSITVENFRCSLNNRFIFVISRHLLTFFSKDRYKINGQ